jgi:hypothetical protein
LPDECAGGWQATEKSVFSRTYVPGVGGQQKNQPLKGSNGTSVPLFPF